MPMASAYRAICAQDRRVHVPAAAPAAAASCRAAARRLRGSNDWMNTGLPSASIAVALQGIEHGLLHAATLMAAKCAGCLVSGYTPILAEAARCRLASSANCRISSNVGHRCSAHRRRSSAAAIPAGVRARARVLISARVKSSVNQPRHGLAVDDLGAMPRRKFGVLRHVGGAADLIFMPGNEHAVARHDQIGLDVVGPLLDRQAVGFEGVFRPLTAGAAMSYDYDPGHWAPA